MSVSCLFFIPHDVDLVAQDFVLAKLIQIWQHHIYGCAMISQHNVGLN